MAVERVDGDCVVVFRGELDMQASDDLWRAVEQVCAGGWPVTLDLAGTTFMDSAGVNLLLRAHVARGRRAGAVVLRSPSEAVRTTLTMAGIADVFRIDDR
jgi:stage II sporulation protein AA (anti-sigma F factor antagonist)